MRDWREAAALALALLDDALDLVDVAQPLESLVDIALALAIIWLLREKLSWRNGLVLVLDALPFVDLIPMWTLYVLYVISRKPGKTVPVGEAGDRNTKSAATRSPLGDGKWR